ncbi:MAG: glycoside hydrolase family 2 [Vallitaleaceae bacterium]|nr:glycoside hydrolase family 2 [Vallitaleaceae bacterium]
MDTPRSEYPRPQFVRELWRSLNGEWEFSFDIDSFDKKIIVPYACETKLSGLEEKEFHDTVWYRKKIMIPKEMQEKNIIIHFGAVDYECNLWVNGVFVKNHVGGHIGFEVDITSALNKQEENVIVLQAIDRPYDLEVPRGKQFWEKESRSIFYTKTTGIWQSVWIEGVEPIYLSKVLITPLLDEKAVSLDYEINGNGKVDLIIEVFYAGEKLTEYSVQNSRNSGYCTIVLDQQAIRQWNFVEEMTWTPESPRLFDVIFQVFYEGKLMDRVKSYFGMRKVSIEEGVFMLNNRPYYQKLLLDQGYWEESLLTAPADEDFVKDISLVKEMGFNGVRKHQKIEDPRFLYHADRLGLLVWGEISAAYVYSRNYVQRITNEWMEEVIRDYNHPCIVVWTPLNESWGVPEINYNDMQKSHSVAMFHITKSLDETRPVVSNDGWEHTCSDLLTVHDYEPNKEILEERYKSIEKILQAMPAGRKLFVNGWTYQKQPVIVSEFGGISFEIGTSSGWGYSKAESKNDFAKRYYDVVSPLLESSIVQGFCYTQLTDVEQEVNGLLTYDRKPKIDLSIIKSINMGKWEEE